MEFTQQVADDIQRQVMEVVKKEAESFGITDVKSRGTYGQYQFRLNITFKCQGATGETQEQRDFKDYARIFDYDPNLLGEAVIVPDGRWVEVTGFKRSARKNKIQFRDLDTDERLHGTVRHLKAAKVVV